MAEKTETKASAAKAAEVPTKLFDVKNESPGLRVFYDAKGAQIAVQPGQVRKNVVLNEALAKNLQVSKNGLTLSLTA